MSRGLLAALRTNRALQLSRVRPRGTSSPLSKRTARPPRVLFVTNTLVTGGAERMLVALATRLPQSGVQPTIACLKDAGPLAAECRQESVPVVENLLEHKTDVRVIPRMIRLIRDRRIDLVIVAHSGGDRMFWSTLAARLAGVPAVVWSHWFPTPGRRHIERPNRVLYQLVDTFVALGHRHRRALARHEFVPAGRIRVIPNAIAVEQFSNSATRRSARRRLNLDDAHVAVAMIANLRPEKRHDVFIKAARHLARNHPNFRFLIIGDGPHRAAVTEQARRSGLDPDVLRLLGPRDDVPELLPGIDVCVLCSDVECFSVTMLQAAAAGVPFIAPAVGALPEFIHHEQTGLLIRPANAADLADGVERIAVDSDLRARCVANARRSVEVHFDIDLMVSRFAALFEDALSAKTHR